MPEAGEEEIEEAVGQELGRMGVQGALALVGKSIELTGNGPPVSIDIALVVDQWALLPAEMRRRKAAEVARRLYDAHRASQRADGRAPDVGLDGPSRTRLFGAIFGIFGLLGAVGLIRFAIPRVTGPDKGEPTVTGETESARNERLARACEAVRNRVYQGATLGPFALEGFVAELWLVSRKGVAIRDQAAVTELVQGGKLAPAADEKLAQIIDGTVEITGALDAEASRRSPGWTGVTVVFRGGYARAFLEEETRPRFLGLAERVARASGADHGALYARCAHLPTHDIGAWFHGPDLAGATAALVYQMGFFAETKVVDRAGLAVVKLPGGELDALRKAATGAGDALQPIIGAASGAISSGPPVSVTFPFTGAVRAVTATRGLVRRMGIAAQAND